MVCVALLLLNTMEQNEEMLNWQFILELFCAKWAIVCYNFDVPPTLFIMGISLDINGIVRCSKLPDYVNRT